MAYMRNVTCEVVSERAVVCDGIHYHQPEEPLTWKDSVFWMYLIGYIFLVLFAGIMSGLTLAIFSLDLTSLKVLEIAGSDLDNKYASRIMPLVRRHYLVLVSLVLANSLAVECMPLLLDRISDPVVAVIVSVSAVLIFGEVLPQAVCGRYALRIGYCFAWLVWTLIAVLFLISWPMSKLLDWLLGKNEGTVYGRAELGALVDIHGPKTPRKRTPKKRTVVVQDQIQQPTVVKQPIQTEKLTLDEVTIIKGALQLATKNAKDAMIKLEEVYMLSIDDKINAKTLQQILDEGHSRIPICWDHNRNNLLGVLLTKRLITADPSKSLPVKEFVLDSRYFYPPYFIDYNTPLYLLLNTFQEGKSTHMGFVTEKQPDNTLKTIGVITLEDIIEELLLEEIKDEKDLIREVIKPRLQLARAHAVSSLNNSRKTLSRSKKKSQSRK